MLLPHLLWAFVLIALAQEPTCFDKDTSCSSTSECCDDLQCLWNSSENGVTQNCLPCGECDASLQSCSDCVDTNGSDQCLADKQLCDPNVPDTCCSGYCFFEITDDLQFVYLCNQCSDCFLFNCPICPTKRMNIPLTDDQPNNPSNTPSTPLPTSSPSSSLPSKIPSKTPSKTPSRTPSSIPTTPFPSESPIIQPSSSPSIFCTHNAATNIGSSSIHINEELSTLSGGNLNLVIDVPVAWTVTEIGIRGDATVSYFAEKSSSYWALSEINECKQRLSGVFEWEAAVGDLIIFDTEDDTSSRTFTSHITLSLEEPFVQRNREFTRILEYHVQFSIRIQRLLPLTVEFSTISTTSQPVLTVSSCNDDPTCGSCTGYDSTGQFSEAPNIEASDVVPLSPGQLCVNLGNICFYIFNSFFQCVAVESERRNLAVANEASQEVSAFGEDCIWLNWGKCDINGEKHRANTCGEVESKPCASLLQVTAKDSSYQNADDFSRGSISVDFSTLVKSDSRIHSIDEAVLKTDCDEGEWCRQTWGFEKASKVCETDDQHSLTMRTEEDTMEVTMYYGSPDACHEVKSSHAKHVPQDLGELIRLTRKVEVGNIGSDLNSLSALLGGDEVSELARVYHAVFTMQHGFGTHEEFRSQFAEALGVPASALTVVSHEPKKTVIRFDTTEVSQWLGSMKSLKALEEITPLDLELSFTSSLKSSDPNFIAESELENQGFEILTQYKGRRAQPSPQSNHHSHQESQSLSISRLIFYQVIFVTVLLTTLGGLRLLKQHAYSEKETKFL